ncbi:MULTISPECIES: alginate export family protein [unclassified Bradyrhizobium]|uniref:alginate export family protein n=1 Tax=unclassified Bradyrhizobium TaxID=2631580 RepID=UPI002FF15D69
MIYVRRARRDARLLLRGAALALPVVSCAAVGQPVLAQDTPAAPAFTNTRYDENYQYLANPAARTGAPWEAFKYVPLDATGTNFVTFGGDLRQRFESYTNNLWGSGPKPNETYGWTRIMPYADLHLGPNFRAFGQLIGAWSNRDPLTRGPIDATGVDLMQGFAQLRVPADSATFTVQAGRQLVAYGSERLIGLRFGPNVPQPFDGGIVRAEAGNWRVDGFYFKPALINPGNFDDRPDDGREIWSLYATRLLPELGKHTGFDAYYIGYHRDSARFDQGTGAETRHTLGSRFFGQHGPWSWDDELFLQLGTFGTDRILAWSVATSTRYTFKDTVLTPYVELKANVISGDANRNDHTLGTFNALFPKGKYFGEIGLIGPYNLINLHPTVGVSLGSGWELHASAVFYWRESLGDGIYGTPGNLLRSAGTSEARYIGTQFETVLSWQATRNTSMAVSYSLFEPGRFIQETGPAKLVHFFGTEIQFRF